MSSDQFVNMLGPLDGARIPGGCESCNAYQTVEIVKPGIWNTTVHHDEDCLLLKSTGGGK